MEKFGSSDDHPSSVLPPSPIPAMAGKIWVEVTLISARGVRRSSSLWKKQWFAVGWIDPKNKYCTNIAKDGSGNSNPTWKTKFATLLDDTTSFQDMALTVEVYSREPIFLGETLQGTTTILLKEFLAKYSSKGTSSSSSSASGCEEVGSYQLRKPNSNKPQGFVDVSIRVTEDKEENSSYLDTGGDGGGIIPIGHGSNSEHGAYPRELPPLGHSWQPQRRPGAPMIDHGKAPGYMAYPRDEPALVPFRQQQNASSNLEYAHHVPYPAANHPIPSGPSYQQPSAYRTVTPPPPPPPANVGYIPTFLPNSEYINMPASAAAAATGRGPARPSAAGLAMGAGVGGAIAAGAVIFGDDFMSGFSIPSSLQDPSITVSMDPTF